MEHKRKGLIEGRMILRALDVASGCVVAERRARNTVLRSGVELIAGLFDGTVTTPVNAMAVGLDPTPSEPPYEMTGLTTTAGDGTTLLQRPAAAIAAGAITTAVDTDTFRIIITIHGVIPADRAVSPDATVDSVEVGEAALGVLASDGESLVQIYNRVVFEPLPKRRDQELAFYWEVDFPYGI